MNNFTPRPRDHAGLAVSRQHFPKICGTDLLVNTGIGHELYPLYRKNHDPKKRGVFSSLLAEIAELRKD